MLSSRSGALRYKSQHSPYYTTFGPQMERFIQIKIDLINRKTHGGTHGRPQSRRIIMETPKNMVNINSLKISAKSLQTRNLTLHNSAQ